MFFAHGAAFGRLDVTGEVTKRRRRVADATAQIVDGSGRLVATATSNCLVVGGRTTPPTRTA